MTINAFLRPAPMLMALLAGAVSAQPAAPPAVASAPAASAADAMQAWQVRRLAFVRAAQGAAAYEPEAITRFDELLTDFDQHPMARTPMENMDILGIFYVRREGPDPALGVIVMNATLGWYDALRFGSESGRAEIAGNEGFFKRAVMLAGPSAITAMTKLVAEHPERLEAAAQQGIAFAEKYKDADTYDRHWPTAYGLEHTICITDPAFCKKVEPMPEAQWPAAWEEAKKRVTSYYAPPRKAGAP